MGHGIDRGQLKMDQEITVASKFHGEEEGSSESSSSSSGNETSDEESGEEPREGQTAEEGLGNVEDYDDDDDEFSQEPVPATKAQKTRQMLLERCQAIKQDNYRLMSRIMRVKQLIKSEMRERRILISRLDEVGDNYQNVAVVMPPDEGVLYSRRSKNPSSESKLGFKRPRKRKSTGNPVGRPKKVRDEPPIKRRPKNPFYYFCQQERSNCHKEYRRMFKTAPSRKDITQVLAQKWQEMSEGEKQVYSELFETEKLRHLEEKGQESQETTRVKRC